MERELIDTYLSLLEGRRKTRWQKRRKSLKIQEREERCSGARSRPQSRVKAEC